MLLTVISLFLCDLGGPANCRRGTCHIFSEAKNSPTDQRLSQMKVVMNTFKFLRFSMREKLIYRPTSSQTWTEKRFPTRLRKDRYQSVFWHSIPPFISPATDRSITDCIGRISKGKMAQAPLFAVGKHRYVRHSNKDKHSHKY